MSTTGNVIVLRQHSSQPALRRPATLIRAARAGQASWKRNRDLARLLRRDGCPAIGQTLPRLRAMEAVMNERRLEKASDYDMHRHVLLMIAILAEMREVSGQADPKADTARGEIPAPALTAISDRGTMIQAHP
ncbi:DUF6477 family protein [Paracoccus sp. Z330]|uniref:DUF6477 family protein n=1 Tax=Paracoccus onchidii TaxID=3017813 RepID=A0ABT4ZF05_9RHOB|nr:DUF6477 family protein [Paracoccus onchidii]MDB6177905.1 DUF6477 family protein [Paracoccus onchidii]